MLFFGPFAERELAHDQRLAETKVEKGAVRAGKRGGTEGMKSTAGSEGSFRRSACGPAVPSLVAKCDQRWPSLSKGAKVPDCRRRRP